MALSTIANLLSVWHSGAYEIIAEIPVEQIFFVIRFAADDNAPGVLNAAMKALRNLFCCSIDEACLEVVCRFDASKAYPIDGRREVREDYTVNDQQVAETDLPLCLVRTNILKRIK